MWLASREHLRDHGYSRDEFHYVKYDQPSEPAAVERLQPWATTAR